MLSLKIALRYIFSKKKHNAINIISGISICGVSLATMAMICILSVFNGFKELASTLFTTFDPQLKIVAAKGKTFDSADERILQIQQLGEVAVCTRVIEENVLIRYKDRQAIGVIKGVDDNFRQLNDFDSILKGNSEFMLHDELVNYGIPGIGLVATLNCGLRYVEPLEIYAPKRNGKINMVNPTASFNMDYLYSPGVTFIVQQTKYDNSYVIAPISVAQKLFEYGSEITALELKLKDGADTDKAKEKISRLLGPDFLVMDRYEQQADVFRIVKIEKLISYFFLTFILVIAGLNVIGLLSMLIIDKRDDIKTLGDMGADNALIEKIFLCEGWIISFIGAGSGLLLGIVLCYLQEKFGIISLGSEDSVFVLSSYPVKVYWSDVLVTFVTVISIGFLTVWYPVKVMCRRLLGKQ